LAHLKGLTNLSNLNLGWDWVSDAGLAHLKALANLSELDLCDTLVTDAGLAHLKGLTKLSILYLHRTKVTDDGLKQLKQALPSLSIQHSPDTPMGPTYQRLRANVSPQEEQDKERDGVSPASWKADAQGTQFASDRTSLARS
jgi:hypothetical protein